MALFSRIRTTTSVFRRLQLQLRYISSASSILSPDANTTLNSKEKSRAAIALLKSEKDPSKILEICRAAALTPEFHLDRIAFSVAIGTLCKEKEQSAIPELLDGFIKTRPDLRNERFGAHAIVLYGQANMLDHAVRLFRELEQLGIQRTVKSLNALLLACVLARDYKEAKRIYVEFPKMYGIEPDLETYNRIIKAFCESGSSSSAYSVVTEMDKEGIKPTATTFGIMLAGFYSEEKLDDVGKVLNMMTHNGVHVGVSTYNIRIQSLCKMQRSSEAKALLDGMLSSGMKPNSVSYCHLVHGFCREGNMVEAKKLFKSMVSKGCKPDSECYFTLLHFLCKAGDFETALRVCRESMEKKWVPNSTTMKLLVNGLASISMVDEAKELVGQVKERFSRNVEMWDEIEAGLSQ